MERTGSMEEEKNVERTGSKKDGGNGRVLIVVDMQKDFVDGSLGDRRGPGDYRKNGGKDPYL